MRKTQPDVALTLLFGVIKWMRMKERPYKLAADILQAKLKVGVLINRVVAAVERSRSDVETLFVGDLVRIDEMGRIAGPRSGNG